MRRFVLKRQVDVTGISGTGIILYGVEWFPSGTVDVFWVGTKTTGQYPSLQRFEEIHCYSVDKVKNAQVIFIDPMTWIGEDNYGTEETGSADRHLSR